MDGKWPFWKWRRWKSISYCLWPPTTFIWNLKLKFQSKLNLCSGNHAVYRQTDGRTDKVNSLYPPPPPPPPPPQCMKRPVAHSLNSTWFWIELPENCCEPLKFIMKYISIQFGERPGHGRPFHALPPTSLGGGINTQPMAAVSDCFISLPVSRSTSSAYTHMQGWVSSGRNLFLPGHPEKSGRNLFLPVLSGQNWKKLEKTVKDVRNVGRKYLSYLISYKRLWLKMHLVNWYCLKTWCKNIKYFWSISSSFIRTKLEETGWQIGETLKDVRNTGKN